MVVVMSPKASEEDIARVVEMVEDAGGDAYKRRTSPYAFQGLAKRGLEILAQMRAETGMPTVTEVLQTTDVELVASYSDVLRIGARNMQNFELLKEVGKLHKPVMLKRGLSSTIEEWAELVADIIAVAKAVGRPMANPKQNLSAIGE